MIVLTPRYSWVTFLGLTPAVRSSKAELGLGAYCWFRGALLRLFGGPESPHRRHGDHGAGERDRCADVEGAMVTLDELADERRIERRDAHGRRDQRSHQRDAEGPADLAHAVDHR